MELMDLVGRENVLPNLYLPTIPLILGGAWVRSLLTSFRKGIFLRTIPGWRLKLLLRIWISSLPEIFLKPVDRLSLPHSHWLVFRELNFPMVKPTSREWHIAEVRNRGLQPLLSYIPSLGCCGITAPPNNLRLTNWCLVRIRIQNGSGCGSISIPRMPLSSLGNKWGIRGSSTKLYLWITLYLIVFEHLIYCFA